MNICDLSLGSEGWKRPRPSYEPVTEDAQKQENVPWSLSPLHHNEGITENNLPCKVLLTKALIIVFLEDAKMDP